MDKLKAKLLKNESKRIREAKEQFARDFKERKENGSFEYLLRRYLTEKQYNKYINKEKTATETKNIALEKKIKEIKKDTLKELEKLERIEKAENIESIKIEVEWKRSQTWGHNPTATVKTRTTNNYIITEGKASGCGYDKQSTAVASALNQNDSILKALYEYKEKKLRQGKTDKSKMACSGVDNRNIIAYGAGYDILPYFEGGVGMNCLINILNLLGFKCTESHGKTFDIYFIEKK